MLPPKSRYSEGPVDPVAREAWSRVAHQYTDRCVEDPGSWNRLIEIPAMRKMLGDVAGKRTLEAGCGPAHYSLWLAQQGAEAWGFDPAAPMIEEARNAAEQASAELHLRVGGVELLPEYPEEHFDIVLFPMMIEYIDDLEATFRQAWRILRPDGFAAISMVHPIRAWGAKYEAEDGEELRLISDYLRRGVIEYAHWVVQADHDGEIVCKSHRRTIGDYVSALVGAGFLIEALLEPEAPPESWEIDPRRCKENVHCPQFMLIKAVRDPRRREHG
jgi:ubiquinone/menaquinone biosynthesis C-methylase UbiE